jgi:hypothetical protein
MLVTDWIICGSVGGWREMVAFLMAMSVSFTRGLLTVTAASRWLAALLSFRSILAGCGQTDASTRILIDLFPIQRPLLFWEYSSPFPTDELPDNQPGDDATNLSALLRAYRTVFFAWPSLAESEEGARYCTMVGVCVCVTGQCTGVESGP